MTDDLNRPGATDQLEGRLRALSPDTDSVILSESSAVRRRGDRRRRMTQAGTVLGVAVLAVGVVGVASNLTDRPTSAPPATTSPSPQVSSITTVLAAEPFLTAGEIGEIGPYSQFAKAPSGSGEDGMKLTCLSDPATWGATVTRSQVYFSDLDATFVETVLQFPDEVAAKAAAQRPLEEFAICPKGDPADAAVADRSQLLGVGDQSYQLSRTTTPTAESEEGYNEVVVARDGAVVVVLDWSSMGSPVAAPGWAWTPEQVQIALDRAGI